MSKKRENRQENLYVDETVNNNESMESIEEIEQSISMTDTFDSLNKKGFIICKKLNMRKRPSKEAEVLKILEGETEVEILDDTDNGWYKVCVGENERGFCMKEFIRIP